MNRHNLEEEGINKLINTLKTYQPTIPDEVTKYLLQTSGCDIDDEISIRLVSLAAQRYITELISIAGQYNKERCNSYNCKENSENEKQEALLIEDLQNALHDIQQKKVF